MLDEESLIKIIDDQQWITSDSLWENIGSSNILKVKSDFLFRSGMWRNSFHKSAILRCMPFHKFDTLLVSHSDREFLRQYYTLFSFLGIKKVFSTNVSVKNQTKNLNAIPIGLTNNTNESLMHSILGDQSYFKELITDIPKNKTDIQIYVNINLGTHYMRSQIIQKIKNFKHIKIDEPTYTKKGRFEFLLNARKHNFVLCPRGNGIDTHRIWESLYIGTIPIVHELDVPISGLDQELPILVVQSWKDITYPAFLEENLDKIQNKMHKIDKLRKEYWISKILGSDEFKN